ncbi:MAG: hypothetical protein IJK98_09525, partial [Clostridia bacterium]|nr:hypothetical protein [Clostridia bacterium]
MDNKIKYSMLIGLAAAAASLPVRAALYRPEKVAGETLPEERVDLARYRKNLSDAIRIRTIAKDDAEDTDWAPFEAFHALLRERYPLIHEKLEQKEFARGSLMFRWPGSDPSLDPIALLAHQDV